MVIKYYQLIVAVETASQHHIKQAEQPLERFGEILGKYLDPNAVWTRFFQANNFVDTMIRFDAPPFCKHILLIYEEIESARKLELRYLKNQLQSGQTCACLIHGVDVKADENLLRIEMIDNGIDLEVAEKTGKLRIIPMNGEVIGKYNLENLKTSSEIVEAFLELLTQGTGLPTAGIGKTASDEELSNPERLALRLEVEQIANKMYTQYDGTWICPYHVNNLQESLHEEWVEKLVLNHDAVIYLPKNSNGLAMRLI